MDHNKTLNISTKEEFISKRGDIKVWRPQIKNVLNKHELLQLKEQDLILCGENSTYPVFIVKNLVIKFFGFLEPWHRAFETECTSHENLAKDITILAPKILAYGNLFDRDTTDWKYIISERIIGQPLSQININFDIKEKIAFEIGTQVKKIHSLPLPEKLSNEAWSNLNLVDAAKRSILPQHLVNQVDDFVKDIKSFDYTFVNGDIVPTHIFISDNKLSGIIDWGDATVCDKHYELGKLMDSFDWNKNLLEKMLLASQWELDSNFPEQALGLCLYRQAMGLTQHTTFDVFYKLPNIYKIDAIKTLEELSITLFRI